MNPNARMPSGATTGKHLPGPQTTDVAFNPDPIKPMKTVKNPNRTAARLGLLSALGLMTLLIAQPSRAGLVGPYPVDSDTLHLWHLDENNGTPANAPTNGFFLDSVSNNLQTSPIVMSNIPGPVSDPTFAGYPPTSFVLMGQPAFSVAGYVDYSNCIHGLGISSCLYSPWTNAPGNSAAQPNPAFTNLSNYINTNTGAFTFETLLKPDFNPIAPPTTLEIICGDSGFTTRAWQFRFNAGRLEFNDINGAVPHQVFATLPTSGPNAAIQGNWYHVAVTFTGNNPTNGDTKNVFKFYWTLMDPSRTNADVLFTTNLASTLHGSVFLTIGGNGRGSPVTSSAGAEGFLGFMDEVRISGVCRKATEMVFKTNQFLSAPIIAIANTNYFVGYGQTLTIPATVFGTAPQTNQWFQNGVALAGQTNTALVISNVTFAANGSYVLASTNASGNTMSVTCQVTVGAAFQQLYDTAVDNNGTPVDATAGGSRDQHWFLTGSPDPNATVPYAIVLSDPLPTGPGFPINGPFSSWIGAEGNGATAWPGTYTWQTGFQLDEGDAASAALSCKVLAYGPLAGANMQTFLNGVETDIPMSLKPISLPTTFVLTNGLQQGSNTLVLVIPYSTGNPMAFRAELTGIGNALPPGPPTITNQPPATETVQYGAVASIPVVGLGRPPLTYQWYSNGVPISPIANPSAASDTLTFIAINFTASEVVNGTFSANYQLVIGNDSGSVTSSVVALTIQIPPLTVASAGVPIWISTNNETNLVVLFSKSADPITAGTAANYSLNNGANILSATLVATNEVVLTTSMLNPLTSYTLTVQNVEDFLDIPMSPSPATVPVGVYPATLALWLRADSGVTTDANGVIQWNDLSGNGNNLFQTYGPPYEPQLVTNAINGEPVIHFTGSNITFMTAVTSPTLAITNDISIFTVVNFVTLAGGTNGMIVSKTTAAQPASYDYYANASAERLGRGNGATSVFVTATNMPAVGVPHILDVVMQGTNVLERLDGLINGRGSLKTTMTDNGDNLYIGSRVDGGNHLTGDLAELMVVGSALSTNDVASLESYLATEYNLRIGPTVNTHATNILFSVAGNNLTLSWPSDHTGWQLQAQTNSLSTGIGTNWVNVANTTTTNQVVIPFNLSNGSVFYRLIYP
jgi:hypothetical protein